ncbi:MAG: redoxin domain-containing protein [Candidatus Omnitrophica bacterium]|nr:redoxin domain-containing protein [Candidatus Omnitrophota bacterium]
MKKIFILLNLMVILSGIGIASASAGVETNSPAPEFSLVDSKGEMHSLSEYKGKYIVLEWVNYDCPFVKKHYGQGNMQSLQKELTRESAVWLSINSSAKGNQGAYSANEVNKIMKENGAVPTAYLFDADGMVGKTYGAKTTPHMFLINPEGNVIYQGAIDSIPSFDPADIGKSENYVKKALSEAKSGQVVSNPTTQAYGCSVKY